MGKVLVIEDKSDHIVAIKKFLKSEKYECYPDPDNFVDNPFKTDEKINEWDLIMGLVRNSLKGDESAKSKVKELLMQQGDFDFFIIDKFLKTGRDAPSGLTFRKDFLLNWFPNTNALIYSIVSSFKLHQEEIPDMDVVVRKHESKFKMLQIEAQENEMREAIKTLEMKKKNQTAKGNFKWRKIYGKEA